MSVPFALKDRTVWIGRNGSTQTICMLTSIDEHKTVIDLNELGECPKDVCTINKTNNPPSAHCTITFDYDNQQLIIKNNWALGRTRVNDIEVDCYSLDGEDAEHGIIYLGEDKFKVPVSNIVSKALNFAQRQNPREYSIDNLYAVWQEYDAEREQINRRKEYVNYLRFLPAILGPILGVIISRHEIEDTNIWSFLVTFLGILVFVIVSRTSTRISKRDLEKAERMYVKRYKCPNPDCDYYFGKKTYYEISRTIKECPKCRCHYTHSEDDLST